MIHSFSKAWAASGIFKAGTLIRADNTAQQLAVSGVSSGAASETFMAVGTVTGVVSNVFGIIW